MQKQAQKSAILAQYEEIFSKYLNKDFLFFSMKTLDIVKQQGYDMAMVNEKNEQGGGKQAIFTVGIPGSGKSTVTKVLFPGLHIIDPDEFKKAIPGYDPKNPGAVHHISAKMAEDAFQAAIAKDESFALDTTGHDTGKLLRRMAEAKGQGFQVVLLYVACSLAVALDRNSKRERVVPSYIVRELASDINYTLEAVVPKADQVITVDNSGDSK